MDNGSRSTFGDFRQLSDEERLAAGAGPDVVRLSVGIESVEDLIADLDQAIAPARPATLPDRAHLERD